MMYIFRHEFEYGEEETQPQNCVPVRRMNQQLPVQAGSLEGSKWSFVLCMCFCPWVTERRLEIKCITFIIIIIISVLFLS